MLITTRQSLRQACGGINSCSSAKRGNLKAVTLCYLVCHYFISTFSEKVRKVTKLELSSGLLVNGPEFSPYVSSVARGWGETNLGLFYFHVYIWQSLTVPWGIGRREVLGVCQHSAVEVMVHWHHAAVLAVALVCTRAGRKKCLSSVMVTVWCFGRMGAFMCFTDNFWEVIWWTHLKFLGRRRMCHR